MTAPSCSSVLLLSLCGHTKLLALIPVPFGDLVGGHADIGGDLHLSGVAPVGIPFKVLLQDTHLSGFLAHTTTFLPLLHVVLVQNQAHFSDGRLGITLGSAAGCRAILLLMEGELALWLAR